MKNTIEDADILVIESAIQRLAMWLKKAGIEKLEIYNDDNEISWDTFEDGQIDLVMMAELKQILKP